MLFSKANDMFEHGLGAPQRVHTGPATSYYPCGLQRVLSLSELQLPLL